MRSPIGPILIILGLAAVVVLALIVVQLVGLRDDLGGLRDELAAVESQVATLESEVRDGPEAVTVDELQRDLDALETSLRDWLIATGADGGFDGTTSGTASAGEGAVLDRIDEVLERIDALEERLDELCEGVPVC